MTKRKLHLVYDKQLSKQELYESAKDEVKDIYNSIKENKLSKQDDKLLKLLIKLDNKNSYFRTLFLLSLYCNYYYNKKNYIN